MGADKLKLPVWLQGVLLLLVMIIAFVLLMSCSGCTIFYGQTPQVEFLNAHPKAPYWYNRVAWNLRNFGGAIAAHYRTDRMPGVPDWNPKGGFWFIRHKSGLPFESYRGHFIEEYLGWRPDGTPGIALRHANAKGY